MRGFGLIYAVSVVAHALLIGKQSQLIFAKDVR